MLSHCVYLLEFFFFKQKTAYEMRISDWSSDVCSSDLVGWIYRRLPQNGFCILARGDHRIENLTRQHGRCPPSQPKLALVREKGRKKTPYPGQLCQKDGG